MNKSINLNGPVNQLGYGVAFTNIVENFYNLNYDLSIFPIGHIDVFTQKHSMILQKGLSNKDFYDNNAPCLKVFHQNMMAERIGKGKFVGFPFFELCDLNKIERHHLRQLDAVVVASNWARNVLVDNGINADNVYIAPLGVDKEIFNTNIGKASLPKVVNDDTTIFLNCGKWEIRKGHDVILEAFNKAFEPDDNVFLIMNCYNPILPKAYSDDWKESYLNSKMGKAGKIHVFDHRLETQFQVASLMNTAHCGIFPARAEGWGLESAEMLSMGKQVIGTMYGAHTEYLEEAGAMLIEVEKLENAYDGYFFHGFSSWASLENKQVEQCIHHLRNTPKTINQAGIDAFTNKFTWKNCVLQIEKAVNE